MAVTCKARHVFQEQFCIFKFQTEILLPLIVGIGILVYIMCSQIIMGDQDQCQRPNEE